MALKLRAFSIGGSMLEASSLQFVMLTWTLKYYSVKTVGNKIIYQICVEFKGLNTSSVMALIKSSITTNLCGVAKLMIRLTLLDSKPRRVSLAPTHSNVQTARVNIKQTQLIVLSGSTGLTRNNILRNTLNFEKIESNQFI